MEGRLVHGLEHGSSGNSNLVRPRKQTSETSRTFGITPEFQSFLDNVVARDRRVVAQKARRVSEQVVGPGLPSLSLGNSPKSPGMGGQGSAIAA